MEIDSIFIQLQRIGFIFIFILKVTSFHVTITITYSVLS